MYADIPKLIENSFLAEINLLAITDTNNSKAFLKLSQCKDYNTYEIKKIDEILIKVKSKNYMNKNLWIIKGMEVHGQFGHFLIIGYKNDIKIQNNILVEEILSEVISNNCLIIVEHPFVPLKFGGWDVDIFKKYSKYYDAVGIHNASIIWPLDFLFKSLKRSKVLLKIIQENNLPKIATSDSHNGEVDASYFSTPKPDLSCGNNALESIKNYLINNQFKNFSGYIPFTNFIGQFVIGNYISSRSSVETLIIPPSITTYDEKTKRGRH